MNYKLATKSKKMKHVFFSLMLLFSGVAMAQNQDELMTDVNTVCNNLDSLKTKEEWKFKNEQLTILKEKYPEHWLTNYYAAYGAIQITYYEEKADIKDMYLDAAEGMIATMEATCPLKDEIHVMKAMLANARLAVDPMKRFEKYGAIFDENLKAAKTINENNPHIYLLKAYSLFYTPKMFGGGPKNAQPYFEKAKEKFKLMTKRSLDVPFWGEPGTDYMLEECKK